MARRKKAPAEEVIELVALLPWWACVLLAVVSYAWLHHVAIQPLVVTSGQGPLQAMFRGLAVAGQYILPLLCLCSAGLSFWRRRQRAQLVDNVTRSDAGDVLQGMRWREFEMLVAEGFRLQGYQVEETGGGGADGGIDLVLSRPGRNGREKFLVQCKQWRAFKVGVDVVRELYGVMAATGAADGFVVTSGRFTDEATGFASGRNVKLVDGPKLLGLIRQAKTADREHSAVLDGTVGATPTTATRAHATACPLCSKPMVRRVAKRGARAGTESWGCTNYPACRGTRAMAP